ncbi:MAG: M23 family metallopeptidase [Candidatus Marinimicrobia bacterium]|nr:M23 family metallopeptidase [Candidatus Neomarinimicrobiota bacterium]
MQSRLDSVSIELAGLFEKDKALRTYADIPEIDQDIRKLGVGGKIIHKTTKLDKFIPNDTLLISDLSRKLGQIERDLNLEKISYKEIYDAVKNHKELIQSTPSIIPVEDGFISSYFGYRRDPFTQERRFHYGIDISAQRGTPVYTTADGVVSECSNSSIGFGKLITIDHGHGYTTYYGHLQKFHVKEGQQVKRGQIIGEVGNSGRSTGTHLHYEVRNFGVKKNPLKYFFTGHLE